MKRLGLAVLISFFAGLAICPSSFSRSLEVAARVSVWPPVFWEENGQWTGMDIDFYTVLEKETGLDFTFHNLPWTRGIIGLKKGTITLMSQLSKTKEREQYIHFIGPYNHEEIVLLVRKENLNVPIASLDEMVRAAKEQGLKIGFLQNVWYGDAFKQKIETDPEFSNQFVFVKENLAEMLLYKRIFGYIEQRVFFVHQIKTQPKYKELAIHNFTLNRGPIYFGVTKKADPKIVERLRKGVQILMENGTFKKVETKWKN